MKSQNKSGEILLLLNALNADVNLLITSDEMDES